MRCYTTQTGLDKGIVDAAGSSQSIALEHTLFCSALQRGGIAVTATWQWTRMRGCQREPLLLLHMEEVRSAWRRSRLSHAPERSVGNKMLLIRAKNIRVRLWPSPCRGRRRTAASRFEVPIDGGRRRRFRPSPEYSHQFQSILPPLPSDSNHGGILHSVGTSEQHFHNNRIKGSRFLACPALSPVPTPTPF